MFGLGSVHPLTIQCYKTEFIPLPTLSLALWPFHPFTKWIPGAFLPGTKNWDLKIRLHQVSKLGVRGTSQSYLLTLYHCVVYAQKYSNFMFIIIIMIIVTTLLPICFLLRQLSQYNV